MTRERLLDVAKVGRRRMVHPGLTAVDPTLAFRGFQLFKLKHDKRLSNVAFDCNLRHYTKERGMKAGPYEQ